MARRKGSSQVCKSRRSEPIDLKAEYGHYYKIEYDPAHGEGGCDDLWLQLIPGRYGEIYPHGGDWLTARTYKRGPVATRLLRMTCCETYQDGDDGVTVLFRLEHFKAVARVIRPRTRRTLSEHRREALRKGGEAYRFRKKTTGQAGVV